MGLDVDLLGGLKSGNENVFRRIMELWYSKLFNFARGYIPDEELVREILQDVFVQLWSKRSMLAENTSINAYLFTVTRNRCIDHIRRQRLMLQFRKDCQDEFQRLGESFQALSDPVLDNIFAQEVQAEIGNAITGLPEQCRRVFTLSRFEGLKNREIGEVLNISEKTVETHITKALKTIRNVLERKFAGNLNLIALLFRRK